MTIGVLPRLITALDKAAKAGAIPAHLPIHLTEFGIQSTPDKISGVSLSAGGVPGGGRAHGVRQPARVAFSQYLISDDPPRPTGIATAASRAACERRRQAKPAYEGFRLPLAVEGYGTHGRAVGARAPQRAVNKVTIERKPKGSVAR